MARKQRYWLCEKCGWVKHRKKKDDWDSCPRCMTSMKRCIKYPLRAEAIQKRWNKRRQKNVRVRKDLTKKFSKCRTMFGFVLKTHKDTNAAWRKLLKAKQRRTFKRYAELFIEELERDLWGCPHHRPSTPGFDERECKCGGGGTISKPIIVFDETMAKNSNLHGTYKRHFWKGVHQITLGWYSDTRLSTFLHETVHWLDSMIGIGNKRNYGSHSSAFFARTQNLADRLRYREYTESD